MKPLFSPFRACPRRIPPDSLGDSRAFIPPKMKPPPDSRAGVFPRTPQAIPGRDYAQRGGVFMPGRVRFRVFPRPRIPAGSGAGLYSRALAFFPRFSRRGIPIPHREKPPFKRAVNASNGPIYPIGIITESQRIDFIRESQPIETIKEKKIPSDFTNLKKPNDFKGGISPSLHNMKGNTMNENNGKNRANMKAPQVLTGERGAPLRSKPHPGLRAPQARVIRVPIFTCPVLARTSATQDNSRPGAPVGYFGWMGGVGV